ncbi:putative FBD-associated F-box protein At5g56410 [Chenopodium quinoa]|uniref:putative FBD-associated F-box protein At5g56410 n=1 Tax=Chenopodium quinoa TaxID=63459 RepID=UPI000B78252E|nr:putative FBD-associated F-box protein At5g56410 [Chenopodium quinoa]
MSSCSRCFESSKQAKLAEGADRISGLPDEILGHILCFLPTKYAVGTSVLSHRWQYLFTLITNFDFDETLVFSSRGSVASYHDLSESKLNSLCKRYSKGYSKFKYFVDRVLMLCKSTHMNKFRLNCAKRYDSNHIKRWIEFALLKGVSELDVFTYQFNSSVTQQLFVCATLVVLKLHGKFEMKLPESYFLPNLKFLQLKSGKFPEKFPLNSLISGCPMLEDLVIESRWGYDVKVITISSPTLINMTLNFTTTGFGWPRTDVLLDLPNLKHMIIMNPPQNFRDSMTELLHGVSSAKHLHLSGDLEVAL